MRVLIISEAIAPASAIASIRWTKIGKYLQKQHHVEVDILTTTKRYETTPHAGSYLFDENLEKDLIYFSKVHEIPEGLRYRLVNWLFRTVEKITNKSNPSDSDSAKLNGHSDEKNTKNQNETFKHIYLTLYGRLLRIKGCSICHRAKLMKIDWKSYDAIISSFSPRWVHLLGKWIKNKYPELVWIADYRDSAISIVDVPSKEKSKFAQIYTNSADCVIGVSQGVLDNLQIPRFQNNGVITNGFDPEDLSKRFRTKKDKFIVSYTGTLYNEGECRRDITPFLSAISELGLAKEIDLSKVLLVYAGGSSDIFNAQMEQYKSVIPHSDMGFISRADSYELQESSSILLLCTWNTRKMQGVVTGKIFEYFSSYVPIVGLCSGDVENSTVKEMLEKTQTGFCFEEAAKTVDYLKLKQFIKAQYQIWEETGFSSCPTNVESIASFGFDHIANSVFQIILSLKKGEQTSE